MIKTGYNFLRLLRPRQWIKNFALFAAITFSGELFIPGPLNKVVIAFFVFCGLSSASYILNDYFDIEKDKLHPFKRFRPLAHGDISKSFALVFAGFLALASLAVAQIFISPAFTLVSIVYLLLQVSYSTFLKSITVIDILAIAAGYIIRVFAGEFASGFHISVWLLLTTISASLFIAIGKRRSELTLISQNKDANIAATRKTFPRIDIPPGYAYMGADPTISVSLIFGSDEGGFGKVGYIDPPATLIVVGIKPSLCPGKYPNANPIPIQVGRKNIRIRVAKKIFNKYFLVFKGWIKFSKNS